MNVEALLRWAGVALVSLAGIFLVSTAVTRGWIGPELQLLLATLGGLALLGGSVYLSSSRRPWAVALGCGGAIVVVVSALATHGWLDLVPPGAAAFLALLLAAAAVGVAIFTRIESIAVVAALVALVGGVDLLGDTSVGAPVGWIAGFVVVATGLGLVQKWSVFRLAPSWLGAAILAGFAISEDVEGAIQAVGLITTVVIAAALWAGSAFAARAGGPVDAGVSVPSTTTPEQAVAGGGPLVDPALAPAAARRPLSWQSVDYRIVGLVPGWVWVMVSGVLNLEAETKVGVTALVVAGVFAALGVATLFRERLIGLSTVMGALTLAAIGFAVLLDGPALIVALLGQAIGSIILGRLLDDRLIRIGGYVAMGLATLLAVVPLAEAYDNGGFETIGAGLATALVAAAWIGGAIFTYLRSDETEIPFDPVVVGAWVAAMAWLGALVYSLPQGLAMISVVWAILACVGLVVGLQRGIDVVRTMAMLTLGVTLFKLVTVDMAEVDVFWRVGLFFLVGMGLIALGLKVPSLMGLGSRTAPATGMAEPSPVPASAGNLPEPGQLAHPPIAGPPVEPPPPAAPSAEPFPPAPPSTF